jgi:hypothetical protein
VRALAVLGILCVALAGCSSGGEPAPETPDGVVVEGWIIDERVVPVVGATARLAGHGLSTTTDDSGHYVLEAPSGAELVIVVEAAGYATESGAIAALSGPRHVLNFSLERLPFAAPRDEVQSFDGLIRCGVVATAQEDPARPHQHEGVRCSQLSNDTGNRWSYFLPAETTGVVVEVVWEPQSEVSRALVLKATMVETGEVLAFLEGTSILRIQLSSVKIAQEMAAGNDEVLFVLEPGAGSGDHEHGAVGAFVQQQFTIYATAFFNGPVPPSYSIADEA